MVPVCLSCAVAQGMGLWSSPVEGQLPSSLETTPSDVLPAAAGGTGSLPGSRHTSKCGQAVARAGEQLVPSSQQQQRERSRQPLAAVQPPGAAVQAAAAEVTPPPPSVMLPRDAPAVPCSSASAADGKAATHSTLHRVPHSSSVGGEAQQQPAPQPPAAPASREPLR